MHNLILFSGLVLSFSAHAAESSDTYNFYFQKAPGPVTVNQGAARPAEAAAPVVSPAAAATIGNVVPTEQTAPERKRWRVYVGYAGTSPGTVEDQSQGLRTNISDVNQYVLGTEFELNSVVAPYAELSYLWDIGDYYAKNGYHINGADQRFDFGLGVKATPLRIGFGKGYGMSLSGMLGYERFPTTQTSYVPTTDGPQAVTFDHVWSPLLGVELSFAFADTFSLGLQMKKITKFNANSGALVLA